MAGVNITRRVTINGRSYAIKSVDNFFTIHAVSFMEATVNHLRVLAFKGRDLLVDKLLSYPTPEEKVLFRKEDFRKDSDKKEEPPEVSTTDEFSRDQNKKRLELLPSRKYKIKLEYIKPFPMIKLKKYYLKRKVREGLDPRIMLATGDYAAGIVVRKVKTRKTGVYYKVATAKRRHRPSGLPLSKLAKIHEFGVANMTLPIGSTRTNSFSFPARPHWRPTFRLLVKVAKETEPEIHVEAIKRSLEKLR